MGHESESTRTTRCIRILYVFDRSNRYGIEGFRVSMIHFDLLFRNMDNWKYLKANIRAYFPIRKYVMAVRIGM